MLKDLEKPIEYLKGVGEKRAECYEKLGVKTVYDLLCHYPRSYIDYTSPVPIADAPTNEPCIVKGRVVKKLPEAHIRKGLSVYKVIFTDDVTDLVIVIYNSEYMYKQLEVDKEYYLCGRITGNLVRKEINSPVILSADTEDKVQPVYHLTEGLSQQMLRKTVRLALNVFNKNIYEPLPKSIMQRYNFCSLEYALENIHFPKDMHTCELAKNRLVFDELLVLQLGMQLMKSRSREKSGFVLKMQDMDSFYNALPFILTNSQQTAIEDCVRDMQKEQPMNRLVQGDVGSGKTAVAAGAAYFVYENGCQSALMAPTEILAEQHYETLKGFLQQTTKFKKLALVITDEQHRFGVEQRAALASKGENPHKLVMSATPIPRTLALMIYGDLDISVLKELPKGRQPVETYAVTGKLRERAFNYVKKYLDEGRQGYIVCPMIEESDMDLQDVKTYAKKLSQGTFKDYTVGLLHGRMSGAQKEQVMNDFKEHKIDLLVSTTVVEVGVDVPNAAIMVIENADRFGLSQLHQLRGRVGRGKYKSSCILITDNVNEESVKRLKILGKTNDGFKISEEDLKLRGPGDFFGSRQHGLPALKIADMSQDMDILRKAQEAAQLIRNADPKLERTENMYLRELVDKLFDKTMSDN